MTSKMKSIEDLNNIKTFGYRGESVVVLINLKQMHRYLNVSFLSVILTNFNHLDYEKVQI